MIYKDLETYLEVIAGYRDFSGNRLNVWSPKAIIQLASYDVSFVASVSEQTIEQSPLSDRQAALVERLIEKYARQLRAHGIEQPDHKNYRMPLRVLNRSSSLSMAANTLQLKFPFNNEIIAKVKEYAKTSKGKVQWNKDHKSWEFAITEDNVNYAVALAQSRRIEIQPEIIEMFDAMLEVEKTPYEIKLKMGEGAHCYVDNAPQSMAEYIDTNIGQDNIYGLVDNAGILGYGIDQEIIDTMKAAHGEKFVEFCGKQEISYDPRKNALDELFQWAITVNRFPIMVYNPNILNNDTSLEKYKKFFKDDEIQVVDLKTKVADGVVAIDPAAKLVYTNIIIPVTDEIPLLITYINLMHGASKKRLMSKAQKVVYYCDQLPKR